MSSLPPPDPQAGEQAAEVAAQARTDVEEGLKNGSTTLPDLFDLVEAETNQQHRPIGHMHLRRALLALPHIGETRADQIIADLELHPDTHLAEVGSRQAAEIAERVAEYQPEGE